MTNPITLPLAALEFTSLPMLGWLAAAVLPWLIHRWLRRQHQTTSWAAVELLLSAMRQRARRVQMQQWLLLAVRTAILVLVALAVAEPALRQFAIGSDGRRRTHRIVVVDQSYSMGCAQGESSRWQRAFTYARNAIESDGGDAVTLIGWGERAENLLGRPTFDRSAALSALDELQLLDTSADLSAVLPSIIVAIKRAEVEMPQLNAHQVVFCTDMGRQTWNLDESRRALFSAVAKQAKVTIVNVAEGPCDNRAITEMTIDPAITIRQREAIITATIQCFGDPLSVGVRVDLLIDGRRVERRQIELLREGESTASFRHRFVGEGPHTVQAMLADNDDCLVSDDQRWLIVDVRPKLRVACFAGQPGTTDDLARALAPGDGLAGGDSTIEVETLSISRLGQLNLPDYAAVFLGSVAELSPREAVTLSEYVRQGGGLAMFLGERLDQESMRGLNDLLPVELGKPQPPGDYRFDPRAYRHPIVAPFRGQTQAGLLGVSISQFHRLQLRADHSSAEVVLAFDTGDPALVVDRFGLGRVAVSALPGSLVARGTDGAPWSSFALSPSYLPVVRELVTYLVGDRWLQQRNLLVGEAATFACPDVAKAVEVRLPDGRRQAVLLPGAEDRGQLVFQETNARGVYRFDTDDVELARFAVNLDGRESDTTPIDPATLPLGSSTDTIAGSAASVAQGDFSFVRTLLAVALVLLLLEIGLAWMLGRGWG